MATKLPRLAVTLDADTHRALAKLASLQRRSRSAIAADLLTEMRPALERITKLLEAAIANRASLPANTAARLEGMERLLGGMATQALDAVEEAVTPRQPSQRRGGARAPARRRGH